MNADKNTPFSQSARYFARYRPDYPIQIIYFLKRNRLLDRDFVVADIGSGTGRSSALFLPHVSKVFGIEPNPDMRAEAERWLAGQRNYQVLEGNAEQTGLPDQSVDMVVCGQSFHWFNTEAAKAEFKRILKDNRPVVLMWNMRDDAASNFMKAYNDFLELYAHADRVDRRKSMNPKLFNEFFEHGCETIDMRSEQAITLEALKGRYLSSAYAFHEEHPRHAEAMQALEAIFAKYEYRGEVIMIYNTVLVFGMFKPEVLPLWKKAFFTLLRIPAFFVYVFLLTALFFRGLFRDVKKKIAKLRNK